jgi:hypothetical protein
MDNFAVRKLGFDILHQPRKLTIQHCCDIEPALVIPRREIGLHRLYSVFADPYDGDPVFFVFVVDVVPSVRVNGFGLIHFVFSLEANSLG